MFLKGYRIATIFLQIIYFMKRRAKLADSNMEFHGFFQLRRDTTGAWSIFHFFEFIVIAPDYGRENQSETQKINFFQFFGFFSSF